MTISLSSPSVIITIPSIQSESDDRAYTISNKTLPMYSTSTTIDTINEPPTYESIKVFSITPPRTQAYRLSITSSITTLTLSFIYLLFIHFIKSQSNNNNNNMTSSNQRIIEIGIAFLALFSNWVGITSGGSLLLAPSIHSNLKGSSGKIEVWLGTLGSAISMWIILIISFNTSEILIKLNAVLILGSVQAIIFEHLSHTAKVTELERRLRISESRLRALI